MKAKIKIIARLSDVYMRLRDSERIVLLGTLWTVGIRVLGMAVTYLSLILFAGWMGDEQFGVYSYVYAVIVTLAIVPLFGFSYASVPLVAEYEVDKAFENLRGLLLFSTGFVIAVSVAVSLIFVLLVWYDIVGLGDYRAAILVGCVSLPLFSLLSYLSEVSRGLGRAVAAFAPLQVLMPLLVLMFFFLSFYKLGNLDATRAIWLWFLSMLLLVIAQLLYLCRLIQKRFPGRGISYEVRRWMRTAAQFFLVSLSIAVLFQMDILILGLFEEPRFVGYYSAAAKTALLITIVLQSINALGARQYATLYNEGSIEELQQLLHSLSRWIIWATITIYLFLLLGGHFVLSIFGENFTQAYTVLITLTLGHAIAAVLGPVTVLLNVTGNQTVTAKVLTMAVVLGVVLNVLLIPFYGMEGAAIAMALTTIFWAFSLRGYVKRILSVETCLFFMKS